MRYMVFDLPAHPGNFNERIPALNKLVADLHQPWVQAVAQRKLADPAALQALLKETVKAGGEGLMLHRGGSFYRGERNDDLLKLKPYEDAEATVVAHVPGKGKYTGALGALVVLTPGGQKFSLGSGFSDAERRDPPAVGSVVTYRFIGFTSRGLPRSASFLRVRKD